MVRVNKIAPASTRGASDSKNSDTFMFLPSVIKSYSGLEIGCEPIINVEHYSSKVLGVKAA